MRLCPTCERWFVANMCVDQPEIQKLNCLATACFESDLDYLPFA